MTVSCGPVFDLLLGCGDSFNPPIHIIACGGNININNERSKGTVHNDNRLHVSALPFLAPLLIDTNISAVGLNISINEAIVAYRSSNDEGV